MEKSALPSAALLADMPNVFKRVQRAKEESPTMSEMSQLNLINQVNVAG